MSFTTLASKEIHDLLREKRFGAWALVYVAVWAVFAFLFMMDMRESAMRGGGVTDGLGNMGEAFYFVIAIALPVLSLFVMTDGIARERESGMLPIVAASPVQRSHVLLSKLVASVAAYVLAFLVTLLGASVFAFAFGFPIVKLVAVYFAVPFLALFLFIAGIGLLLGVVCPSSKVALGTAVGIYFPLFFVNPFTPLDRMVESALVKSIIPLTPFYATQVAAESLLNGGFVPWTGLFVTAGVGVVAALAAFVVFARQEGAQ